MTRTTCSVAVACFIVLLTGCRNDRDRERTPPPPAPAPVTSQGDSLAPRELDRLVQNITRTETPAQESDALKRFRDYLVDHKLTYRTRITRTTDTREIDSGASTLTEPLRVEVEVSQGRQVLRTFTFVPRDNRNLVLLGQ